jgi:hypothetical protein
VFDNIDNSPMVRLRKSDAYSSSFILVDANEEEDAAPFPKLPVSARPGGCIEVEFILYNGADCALGSEIEENVQAGTKFQLSLFAIVS